MVARGAGAARPTLLACRQWAPRGVGRRPPSPGAGAWQYAALLPWQLQCPGPVCAALAAGLGGLGPVPGVLSPLFPPSCPAFPALCVAGRPVWVSLILSRWYAIPCGLCVPRARSGCPLVFPACPLCVCALALSRRPRPPPLPWLVWRAHLARSRCWALVGPFHSVRAPPLVWPRSRAPFGLLGGGRPGFASPYLTWGCAHPVGWVRAGGPVTNPTARCGDGTRAPGGGASCLGAERPGSGALPPPTTHPFGRAAGAHYPLAAGAGGAGVGTRHRPHSARSCELALRAVGAA